ncbi:uncharacterized protein LOC112523497 [Cynara cardunculus var. scolymus]|uniref:Transmembrane protein n=1 Tax=Cynara cardunculus var. scolymus TaxID=59895 RepID=A0A103XVY5_CYNCS|nr:uncharacterized protein LOC112523497 [Cynara cardunculus var. scolymus]KVH97816.1 hypothetical protein Ccrd_000080 [Cynara cardunculus var. scolymus]
MSQQQMPVVYPVSDTVPTSNNSSNGSYGAVFIVLAVIVVVSAIGCFLGRLCNKGQDVARPYKDQSHPPKEKDVKRNTNVFQTKDGDIESGYDKRLASAKVAATSGEPSMAQPEPFGEPMARPNSFQEPTVSRTNSYDGPNQVRANSFHEPAMGRPSSFHEPTMRQPNYLQKGEFQGDQVKFGADRGHEINFKPRTRAQRY